MAATRENAELVSILLEDNPKTASSRYYAEISEYLEAVLIISSRTGNLEIVKTVMPWFMERTSRAHCSVMSFGAAEPRISVAALMAAVIGDHEDVVELLVKHGVDFTVADGLGNTAFTYCRSDRVWDMLNKYHGRSLDF